MALYGKSSVEYTRTILDDGMYKVTLVEVEDKTEENIFERNDDGTAKMRDVFLWTFDTVDNLGDDGRPVRFFYRTNQSYGNDKASLTKFLDGVLNKRLTSEEFGRFDLQSLEGETFMAMVERYVGKDGKERNKVVKIKRTGYGPPLAAVEPTTYGQDAGGEDHFVEEDEVKAPPARRAKK